MNTRAREIRFDCNVNADALMQGSVVLDCVASNNSNQAIWILPWNTPLESRLRGRFLEVTTNRGEELEYRGLMVKRAAPSDEDYLTLEAGESLTNSLDLTNSYNFCPDTSYQINYSSSQANDSKVPVKLWMPGIEFSTNGSFPKCEPRL